MNSQELRNLHEAYMDVYEQEEMIDEAVEQIDELSVNKMNDYINKAEKDRGRLNKKWDQGTATSKERKKVFDREEGEARASKKIRQKTGKDSFRLNALDKLKSAITKEEVEIFDVVLEYLVVEGYAETPEAAEAIIVNMSEDWRKSIVEEVLDEGQKKYPTEKVENAGNRKVRTLRDPNISPEKKLKTTKQLNTITTSFMSHLTNRPQPVPPKRRK